MTADLEGLPLNQPQTTACVEYVQRELLKYPEATLAGALRSVTLLSRLTVNGRAFGGYADDSDIYLVCTNKNKVLLPKQRIAKTLHHEISSVLWRAHGFDFPTAEWNQANAPDFQYQGWGALAPSEAYLATPALREQGFVIGYARAGLENDFNSYCELLFTGDPELWANQTYPRIAKKTQLTISFLSQVDSSLDEGYFRALVGNTTK
jgi:hypothetical protein